jgi:hypothetical protein
MPFNPFTDLPAFSGYFDSDFSQEAPFTPYQDIIGNNSQHYHVFLQADSVTGLADGAAVSIWPNPCNDIGRFRIRSAKTLLLL